MSVKETLLAVRALLDSPDHFCQNSSAVTAGGLSCESVDPQAVRFCVYGAVLKLHGGAYRDEAWLAISRAADALYPEEFGAINVNDNLGYDAVIAVLDHAIATEGSTP